MESQYDFSGLHIILADDDADDRFFFARALAKISPVKTFQTFSDGVYLMEHLRTAVTYPDVIFLDENMPRRRGSECLVDIRKNGKLKHIPIIMYSTHYDIHTGDEFYKNGATYFFIKTNFDELVLVLEKVLHEIGTHTGVARSRATFLLNGVH